MINKKTEIIHELNSPLFRLMWVHNITEQTRKRFGNNISAFHIGNGFVLSVAHNIKIESQLLQSIDQAAFSADILPFLNPDQIALFDKCYPLDAGTDKRYLIHPVDQNDINSIVETLKLVNYDTRWLTLMQKNICNPYLILQFTKNDFYEDPALAAHFDAAKRFHEPSLNRYTFLVEVELVEAFYSEDIALYKIINTHADVIARIPKLSVDYNFLNDDQNDFYCLQSSPGGNLGRLLNKAQIEGYLDHHGVFSDRIGGNYTFEGNRYLIKGYFRFGSSGAPYIFYDPETENFKVNAIQSEACPIQLSINNNRDGNFQYINAIASPLSIIQNKLEAHLNI